ncbi:beta-ketoacyl-[acyl-carrier-protein] synthase family protein [Paenibacillus filicis]|uniref:Nodulation protein E n=1 Tax=Paenibacillus gyeongsangnamensis TaxID=3388067 RepID=A0ABT4QIZ7_9BACL|nr:beta-ketoacyl-[acyl-carrier-protein] synthase family protein [Paenibacillus filicis]MCZ8516858.1 beta-ketoacyl-[acyl-carrier-protein] synthase family protein [Paenibacillus filicis]
MNKVVITGFGVLTPFGFGEDAIVRHMFNGDHGFKKTSRFDSSRFRSSYSAESNYNGSLLELSIQLSQEAIEMAGLPRDVNANVLIGTSGDFDILMDYWKQKLSGNAPGVPLLEKMASYHAEKIAANFGFNGKTIGFNNGCIASSNALGIGYEMIAQGKANVAVCGGYALVCEEQVSRFNSGRALSKDGLIKSFSADRSGLLLGDGGAIFVLESEEHAQSRGASCLLEICGWGMTSDAFHITQPHPEGLGMAMAMEKALRASNIECHQIKYINAHGTGSVVNDDRETKAYKKVFGDLATAIPVSSTKTMTGHSLEGTGAMETAILLVSMKHNFILPTIHYLNKDPNCDLDYVPNEGRKVSSLDVTMNLNASSGGNNVVTVFRKTVE